MRSSRLFNSAIWAHKQSKKCTNNREVQTNLCNSTTGYRKRSKTLQFETLKKSFSELSDGELLKERDLQNKIDNVFTQVDFMSIEEHSVFKSDGKISIDYLSHNGKAILFDLLEIDSVSCITESDVHEYENGDFEQRLNLEIPTYYYSVSKCDNLTKEIAHSLSLIMHIVPRKDYYLKISTQLKES